MESKKENKCIVELHFEIPDSLLSSYGQTETNHVFQLTSDVADELFDAPPTKRGKTISKHYSGAPKRSNERWMVK